MRIVKTNKAPAKDNAASYMRRTLQGAFRVYSASHSDTLTTWILQAYPIIAQQDIIL